MFNQIKKLAGETLIYGLSTVITSLLGIFLIPLYSKLFLPSQYGVINLINVTLAVLYVLVIFGLDSSTALWFWKKEDDTERKKTFTTWICFHFIFSLAFSLPLLFFAYFFSQQITGNASHYFLLILAACNFPFWTFQKIVNMWFRLQRKPMQAVGFALFVTICTLVFTVVFVVVFKWGLTGVFAAQLGSSLLSFLFGAFSLRKIFDFRLFSRDRLKEMVTYSYPLVPAAICTWALTSASSFFIKSLKGIHDVGVYQIGVNIASLSNIVISAFLQAWSPFALSIHKDKDHKQIYSTVFSIYGIIGSVVVCGIFIFSREILTLFTSPQYYDAYWVAGIFSLNIFISGVYQITSIGCNLMGTNTPYGAAVIIGAALSIILFYILIPVMGKEGAAITTTISNGFIAGFISYKAQKLYPIPYDFPSFIFVVILLLCVSIPVNLFLTHGGWHVYGLKLLCFCGYMAILFVYFFRIKKLFVRFNPRQLLNGV